MHDDPLIIRLKKPSSGPLQVHRTSEMRVPVAPTPPPAPRRPTPVRRRSKARRVYVLVTLAFVAILLSGLFIQYRTHSASGAAQISARDTAEVIVKVDRLMRKEGKTLPTGEDPTIATVSDLAPLKDQPFFKDARLGDRVLMYTKAREAILYDPDSDTLIRVAPITFDKQQ